MELNEITPKLISDAFTLFDATLRDSNDWQSWEANENHKYAILHADQHYPVKQILSMASGIHVSEFYGGEGLGRANDIARKNGFEVISLQTRNPAWSRDELIITLDFYHKNRKQIPGQSSPALKDLSQKLNQIGRAIFDVRSINFRNANGVHMKLMNFRSLDPEYFGQGLKNIGKGDRAIWAELGDNPQRCSELKQSIEIALSDLQNPETDLLLDDEEFEAEEGRTVARVHYRRERNKQLINRKKQSAIRSIGFLACEACGFRFDSVYGERGEGYIECHHIKPIHQMIAGEKTHIKDLVLLCANCHRMVHSRKPWLTIKELREIPGVKKLRE